MCSRYRSSHVLTPARLPYAIELVMKFCLFLHTWGFARSLSDGLHCIRNKDCNSPFFFACFVLRHSLLFWHLCTSIYSTLLVALYVPYITSFCCVACSCLVSIFTLSNIYNLFRTWKVRPPGMVLFATNWTIKNSNNKQHQFLCSSPSSFLFFE